MNDLAEYGAWFHHQVQAGLEAANAGDVLTADIVEAEADAWRADVCRRNGDGWQPDRYEDQGPQRKR